MGSGTNLSILSHLSMVILMLLLLFFFRPRLSRRTSNKIVGSCIDACIQLPLANSMDRQVVLVG